MLKSMLTHLREASKQEADGVEAADAGFTLIELMVVLLIIAILLAIAIPTFLGVANSAGDRAAQSNLTNALTEVKALYQNSATYSPSNVAYTPTGVFTSSAPEFAWVSTACNATPGNCVSVQVVDSSAIQDGQGVELAVYSAKTTTCWYALDLESTPTIPLADTPPGIAFSSATHVQSGAITAGVFYAKKTGSAAQGDCSGGYPSQTATTWSWGGSYSTAPAN